MTATIAEAPKASNYLRISIYRNPAKDDLTLRLNRSRASFVEGCYVAPDWALSVPPAMLEETA